MKLIKKITSLLVALGMILLINTNVFAVDMTITFKGAQEGFDYASSSEYTATDLFKDFKNVMPGDKLNASIKIINEADDCDYVLFYLKAIVLDENGNPLTYSESFENQDGKDRSDIPGKRDETVDSTIDFLSKLTMRVYNGTQLIYNTSPDKAGALINHVLLGKLTKGESITLRVELDIPIDLGNDYANRVGEVNWSFLAECIDIKSLTAHKVWDDSNYPNRPDSLVAYLTRDGADYEKVVLNKANQWSYTWDNLESRYQWSVREEVPSGYEVSYKTENNKISMINRKEYKPTQSSSLNDLTVKVVWSDKNNRRGLRPNSVIVTLYKNDIAVEKIILDDLNDWTYTWKDLDSSFYYSVLVTGLPKAYTASYNVQGNVVIITNTLNPKNVPSTGIDSSIVIYSGLVVVGSLILILIQKKTNKDKIS